MKLRAFWLGGWECESRRPLVGTSLFFALAPGVVAGLVPWLLTDWEVRRGDTSSSLRLLGLFLLAAGAGALVGAFVRFVVEGLGTPGPRRADRASRRRWPLSLRTQPHVPGGSRDDSRTGDVAGPTGACGLGGSGHRRSRFLRAPLRGANSQPSLRSRIRRVPRGRSALVAAVSTVDEERGPGSTLMQFSPPPSGRGTRGSRRATRRSLVLATRGARRRVERRHRALAAGRCRSRLRRCCAT